jgi:glycosyltransferase involved in cell wall biosynthesis
VQQLVERLAARGHQVTVLCSRHAPSTPLGESWENGVRVVRLWPAPVSISRGMLMPGYPFRLWRLLGEHDAVSVHTPMLETALVAVLARLAGKPVVATHHGDLVLPGGKRNRLITALMFAFYKFMARRAAALVGHTEDYSRVSYYLSPFLDKLAEVIRPSSSAGARPGAGRRPGGLGHRRVDR